VSPMSTSSASVAGGGGGGAGVGSGGVHAEAPRGGIPPSGQRLSARIGAASTAPSTHPPHSTDTQPHAALSNAPGTASARSAQAVQRALSALTAARAQRLATPASSPHSAPPTQATSVSGGDVSAGARRPGRVADTSPERLARTLQQRQKLAQEIRKRVGQGASWQLMWSKLTPLEQLLPCPPSSLLHQLAAQWMQKLPGSDEPRGPCGEGLSIQAVRDCFLGSELRLLSAMAGLPVLIASSSGAQRMAKTLLTAVHLYAERYPALLALGPSDIWWEGDLIQPGVSRDEATIATATAETALLATSVGGGAPVAVQAPPAFVNNSSAFVNNSSPLVNNSTESDPAGPGPLSDTVSNADAGHDDLGPTPPRAPTGMQLSAAMDARGGRPLLDDGPTCLTSAAEPSCDWILELDGPADAFPCGATADRPCGGVRRSPSTADAFEVCCYVALRKVGRGYSIRVHYQGFPAKDNQWQSLVDAQRADAEGTARFFARHKNRLWKRESAKAPASTAGNNPSAPDQTVGSREMHSTTRSNARLRAPPSSLRDYVLASEGASESTSEDAEPDAARSPISRESPCCILELPGSPSGAAVGGPGLAATRLPEPVSLPETPRATVETDAGAPEEPHAVCCTAAPVVGPAAEHDAQAPPGNAASSLSVTYSPALPQSVHVKRVAGDGHCFWSCVETALGETRVQLRERIRATIASIHDAAVLTQLGLWDSGLRKDSSPDEVLAAKRAYFRSAAFVDLRDGGTAEMLLLCYAFGGELIFLTVSNSIIGVTPVQVKSPFHPVSANARQVALHHCSFSGEGKVANHWDLFEYRLAGSASDAPRLPYWPCTLQESVAHQASRLRMLQREADDDTQRKRTTHQREIKSAEKELERMLQREEQRRAVATSTSSTAKKASNPNVHVSSAPRKANGQSKSSTSVQRRLSFSPLQAPRARADCTTSSASATAAPPPPRPAAHADWRQRHVRAVREIPRECSPLFVQTVGQLLEAYKRYSEAQDWPHAQDVLQMLLDFPDQTLRIGSPTQQRQWLDDAGAQLAQALGKLPQPSARTVTQNDSAAPPRTPEPVAPLSLSLPLSPPTPDVTCAVPVAAQADSTAAPSSSTLSEADLEPNAPFGSRNVDRVTAAVRRAVRIIRTGGPHALSRAAKALAQTGLAPMTATTRRKLRELHPQAKTMLPPLPAHRAPGVLTLEQLDTVLRKRIHNGSAPGPSGWTGSHLMLLWDSGSTDARAGLTLLIRDICNGVFSGETKKRLLACRLIPLDKKDGGVRPVAIAEVFVKCAAHCAMALIEDDMQLFFPSIQYGVRRAGGSETAAHLIRAILRQASSEHVGGSVIALKTDFKNAFNTASRRLVWQTLLAHRKAEPILKAFYWQYSDPTPLLVFDGPRLFDELESTEGVRQGDPFAAFAFALAVQPLYERALQQAPACKGVSIQDDFTLVGPAEQVMAAYDYILGHAHEFGLELRVEKCQVFVPPGSLDAVGSLPAEAHPAVAACQARHLQHHTSMEALGVMYGDDAEIEAHSEAAASSSESFLAALKHPEMPIQMAYSLLRYCGVPRLGFLARTTHPDRLDAAARRFDRMALETLLEVLRLHEASLAALQLDASESDVEEQQGCSDARPSVVTKEQLLQRISLPLSAGGLGIRPVHRIRHAAYFSSLLQCLPEFLRLYPELQTLKRDENDEKPSSPAPPRACFQHTELYAELEMCRLELLASGAGNRRQRRQAQQQQLTLEQCMRTPPPATVVPTPTSPPHADHATPRPASAAAAPAVAAPTKDSSPLPALHKGTDETWQAASRCARESQQGLFVLANKLQQRLTEGLELTLFEQCFASCGPYQQAILTSLRDTADCSAWLTVLPTEPAYRMRNEQFQLAVRHRLGLLPYDDLRDEVCLGCRARNAHIPTFLADPDHLHACVHETGASVTLRHHRVVSTLATLARSVGYVVRLEPSFAPHAAVDDRRGDLLLLRHNSRLLVDVTVRRPTGRTELRRSEGTPLATAAAAEKAKHAKYDEACGREGLTMVPFALESYGAKGKQAGKLLLKLANASEELSAAAFLQHASAALSVALQCGNADIAARGVQSMRVHQLAEELPLDGSSRRRRQRRPRPAATGRTAAGGPLQVGGFHTLFHAAAKPPACRSGLYIQFDAAASEASTAPWGWRTEEDGETVATSVAA